MTMTEKRYIYYTMDFEYDPAKSNRNVERHGVGFDEARAIWNDADRIEIPARTVDEPRWMVIGKIGKRYWSAVITYRGDTIRLISVRRSRKEEVEIYEGEEI